MCFLAWLQRELAGIEANPPDDSQLSSPVCLCVCVCMSVNMRARTLAYTDVHVSDRCVLTAAVSKFWFWGRLSSLFSRWQRQKVIVRKKEEAGGRKVKKNSHRSIHSGWITWRKEIKGKSDLDRKKGGGDIVMEIKCWLGVFWKGAICSEAAH